MKNTTFSFLLLSCIGLMSCNKNQKNIVNPASIEKPVTVQCYAALYEKDTLTLQINTMKSGKLTGKMDMKIQDMPIKTGKIAGEIKGDTLFVDYTFIQGTNEKVVFKNPMAFLKSKNELILGNGKIESYLGASYFAKGEPIDFENVKYKFTIIKCAR